MFKREITRDIFKYFGKDLIIVIFGPRQIGKTTLVQEILRNFRGRAKYLNADFIKDQQQIEIHEEKDARDILKDLDALVIDEAQRILDIGIKLKILVDLKTKTQIIATGSSSFELANTINEPLTGRTKTFFLYPLSFEEMLQKFSKPETLEKMLRFGSYPAIVTLAETEAKTRLDEITGQYLYKDLLEYEGFRKPKLLVELLQLLALQVGSEVSLGELAGRLETSRPTIERYIDLLEKSFVIFRLNPLRRNMRRAIGKNFKVYFYDLGIRNDLIQKFDEPHARDDIGGLWENFCILERLKRTKYSSVLHNSFFWRDYYGSEVDYIEEYDGRMHAYEFKWNEKVKGKLPKAFAREYPSSTYEVITPQNFYEFVKPVTVDNL